jgi:hypothetical protein
VTPDDGLTQEPFQAFDIAEKNIIFIEKSIYDIDYTNEFDIHLFW